MNSSCPFCKSKNLKIINEDNYQYNSYSFILAKHKNCTEIELIRDAQPMLCESCSLSFFYNWISLADNLILYNKLVPTHPSCLNIVNKKKHFKSDYLLSRLINLSKSNISDENQGKSRREANSVLNSIGMESIGNDLLSEQKVKRIIDRFKEKILNYDLDNMLIAGTKYAGFNHKYVEELIRDYNSISSIEDFVDSNKNKFSYTEIGCPTWGFLNTPNLQNISLCFSDDIAENFWSSHHEFLNKSTQKLNRNYSVKSWNEIEYSRIIGAFACIDHSNNLSIFIKNLIAKTKFLIGTFEESPLGVAPPIQHHYNLNYQSLNYLLSTLSLNYTLLINKSLYEKYTFFEIKLF